MKKGLKFVIAAMALVMSLAPATFIGCDNGEGNNEEKPPIENPNEVKVTGVTLVSAGSATSLKVGATLRLGATVTPDNATNKKVTYSTSAAGVATVSSAGIVTGVSAGTVTITVTTEDGGFTDTIELTVTAAEDPTVEITAVSVASTDVTFAGNILAGDSVELAAAVSPAGASAGSLTWTAVKGTEDASSALTKQADGSYLFTPATAGEYTVRAAADDEVYGEYTVTAYAAESSFTGKNAQLVGCSYNDNGYIGAIQKNGLAKITFTIESESAQTVTLEPTLAASSASDVSFAKQFTVTVNGDTVTPDRDQMYSGTSYGWTNWGTVSISDVELVAGENVIVFAGGVNVNTNFAGLTVYGDEEVTEVIPTVEDPIDEGTDNIFEGETAVMTDGSTGKININSNDANAHGNTSLGNVNNNNGATLTFTVNAEEACKAGLYASLAFGGKKVSGIFSLTVNGEDVAIPASFDAIGNADWKTYAEYWLANIDLKAGENVIVLTVTGGCGNFDYINILAPCTVTAPAAPEPEEVKVTGVTLAAEGSATSLEVGGTLALTATVAPDNATNKKVTYSTSAEGVATVSAEGVVTGVSAGTVTITVTTEDGSFTDTVELTVTEAVETAEVSVAPSDVTFAGNILVNQSVGLVATITSSDLTADDLTWTAVKGTEDASSALAKQADGSYLFTPASAGEYTIRAALDGDVYGEYTVTAYAAKTELTGENAQLVGCSYNETNKNIGGIQKGGVAKITFTISSESAQTVTLEVILAASSASDVSFSKQFTVTVNGKTVAADRDQMYCGTSYGWSNRGVTPISGVELVAGENVIVFAGGTDVNTNFFGLAIYGEKAVTEVIPTVEEPIDEGTDNIFEGEKAAMTNGSLGKINTGVSDATASGGTSLGNTNSNSGATLTFTVSAEEACKAGLYANLALGAAKVSGIFTLTVNGEDVAIPSSFDAIGTANWHTYAEYWLANIDLKAGENTIVLTVTGACGNFDYINILAPCAVTEPNEITEVSVAPSEVTFAGNLLVNQSVKLAASVTPVDFTAENLIWTAVKGTEDASSALEKQADGSCLFTPATAGEYTIRAAASDTVYGEYTVTVYAAKTDLTGENAQLVGCSYNEASQNIGGLQKGVAKITFTISSESAQTVTLETVLAATSQKDSMFSKQFTVTVNGKAITPDRDQMYCGTSYGWSNKGVSSFSGVELIAGENVIVFVGGADVNTNFFGLTIYGEKAVTEVIPTVEEPIDEGTDNIFEGETAALTSGKTGAISTGVSDATASGGTSLGNVNNNNGATLTFTVDAAEACKAGLYVCLAFGGQKVSGIFSLTVNGKDVAIPASFDAIGTANWHTYAEYWFANIDLNAGENTIVLTVTGGCGNFDYINILAPCAVTAPQA